MRCNCRLEVSDMGYLECELEKNHLGNHQFSHNGESWPKRKYQITWERDAEKDFIFLEEHLRETNINEVCNYIQNNFNIISFDYKFDDDVIYGATPILWLFMEYFEDFQDTIGFYEVIWDEESKIREYIDQNLLFRNKYISREMLSIHLSVNPKEIK